MSQKRERSDSSDEEDKDEDRQSRDHQRSKSYEDSSRGKDSEASSEQLKMLEPIPRKKMYVAIGQHHFDRRSHNWRVAPDTAKPRIVYLDPPGKIDQPSTSGTRRSSEPTKSPETRSSGPRRRGSSIDTPITFSADRSEHVGKKISTKPGATPETRRVRRRSPSPTRDKKNPSRDRSSKSYGSEVAHGSKQNIAPDLQGHVANISPQEYVQKESDHPLHQTSWNPEPAASSSLKGPPQQYSEKLPIPLSLLPLASDSRSSDQSYPLNQTSHPGSSSRPSDATKQQLKSTASKKRRPDKRKDKQAQICRHNLVRVPLVNDAALQFESSTATPITMPTTPQAEISSTRSSTEPTPLQPEAPKVEFNSTAIKSEIEKPSDDSMVVASTTKTTVSDVMLTVTTVTQTAASTSESTAASNNSEPETSATLSLPTKQIDTSSDDEECDE